MMGTEPPSLWSYCSSLNRLCPKLMPVTKIYADLRWSTTPFTSRSVVHKFGCTQGSGLSADGVCHVVTQLSTWNEVLVFINMELREGPPGQLSLLCLHGMCGSCGLQARERHATILVHWLLTVHRCVTSIELDDNVIANFCAYFPLYCDALQRSLGYACTCSTIEVGHTERPARRTAPLVCAFGPECSLEEITLDLRCFDAYDQKTLLYAVAANTTLKKVNVERLDFASANSLCEAIRETGTADRVHFPLVNVRGRELACVKKSCGEVTKISLNIGTHGTSTRREYLRVLTLCTHLTVLNLNIDGRVCKAEAHLLSMFLRQSQCIREFCMSFYVRPSALRDILRGLSTNTALEKLVVTRCVLDKQSAALLASIVGDSETIWHFGYEAHCVASCRFLLIYLAKCLPSNTALVSLDVSEYRAVIRHSAAVKDVVRRNAALVDCAAHFVLGTRNRHCAEAFEHVASGRGIVARVQEMAAEPCADRARAMIREATRWLLGMIPFMKMAGVVKNDLSWDENVDYRERLEILPPECWLHVRQFIKVRDVLHWAPSTTTWRKQAFWGATSGIRRSKLRRLQT
ncbi:hypothetical protein HPB49_006598 [Dermacentor silvarum]|uniref:Uncharacterized protein n=1 Tax=Dermacentor silvarum TaxID=543639 RepID=A0ACB8DWN4_DERSI|nr:hypothetical protein HPB49_006598 [Dermacentor silvarum]